MNILFIEDEVEVIHLLDWKPSWTLLQVKTLEGARSAILEGCWDLIVFDGNLGGGAVCDTIPLVTLAKANCPNAIFIAWSTAHNEALLAAGCTQKCSKEGDALEALETQLLSLSTPQPV